MTFIFTDSKKTVTFFYQPYIYLLVELRRCFESDNKDPISYGPLRVHKNAL